MSILFGAVSILPKSVYKIMAEGGRVIMQNLEVWTAKVPPSVRIFGYLMMKRKILTRDVLRRRGVNCERHYVICLSNSGETAVHLLSDHQLPVVHSLTTTNQSGEPTVLK